MSRAAGFDRAVGYFRSTAFIIAWPALKAFAERDGHIQILCSHVLADDDIDAPDAGYEARADEVLAAKAEISALMSGAEGG